MPECGICYENHTKLKTLNLCKHEMCFNCFPKIIEASIDNGNEATCPFCRSVIREASDNYEVEYWLNLEPADWNSYSITLKNGTEIIRTYRTDEPQPTWRNDDNVMILKRNRQRKRCKRNRRNTY